MRPGVSASLRSTSSRSATSTRASWTTPPKRAAEPMLGLVGAKGKDPEVPLAELERLRSKGEDDLIEFLHKETGKSENALRNALKLPERC